MKKTLLVLFLCKLAFAQGTLEQASFYSSSLNDIKNVEVYLPEGYDPLDTIRYPVIYFLHAAGGNHNSYSYIKNILDNHISGSLIKPVIFVKPDGSAPPWSGSFYTNSILYGNFEDYIAEDLISFIDSAYKTYPVKNKRSIMGHSMGGFGTMKIAFKHSEKYRGAASHSGPLDFNKLITLIPRLLNESGSAPYTYDPGNGPFSNLFFSMAGAFTPNLFNPPYNVDLPVDANGNPIDSIWNKWLEHNPVLFAEQLPQNHNLSIYFDCGIIDEVGLYPFNTAFRDSLASLNLEHEFQSFLGLHTFNLPQRIPISLIFLDSIMRSEQIPVELIAFNGIQNGNRVELNWTTATEINNSGFEVERKAYRAGGMAWEKIAFVEGSGTTTKPREYSFVDEDIKSGKYKYRLKQIDYDGSFEYSNEIEVEVNNLPTKFALYQNYPNPFNPVTNFKFRIANFGFVELIVYDVLGNEAAIIVNEFKEAGEYEISWNAEGFASGVYIYQISAIGEAGDFTASKKLMLLK